MKTNVGFYELSNGIKIPKLGFGTYRIENGEKAVRSVEIALENGYTLIDTAEVYGNEESVGKAVKNSGIPREDLFITSKLANDMHGYDNTFIAFKETLKKLDMNYIDLFLIHWPNPIKFRSDWENVNAKTWKAFEDLYDQGKIKAIGISNFRQHHIDSLLKSARIKPMVNQLRICPGAPDFELVKYSREKDLLLEAYSPLAVGEVLDVPLLVDIAKKHNRTTAQVALRWSLENGFLPIPKSSTESRIKENIDVLDFELDVDDMKKLDELRDCCGEHTDPDDITF